MGVWQAHRATGFHTLDGSVLLSGHRPPLAKRCGSRDPLGRTARMPPSPQPGRPHGVDDVRLDYVSLGAGSSDLEQLGLWLTPTRAADRTQARALLDCMYLDVVPPQATTEIAGRGWFLRPHDLSAAADVLRGAGIRASGPTTYRGPDGTSEDVEVQSTSATPALPILTRRVDLPAWPPSRGVTHPNGATTITEVHVGTGNAADLLAVLGSLGARVTGRTATFEIA